MMSAKHKSSFDESLILQARAEGRLSAEGSFNEIYIMYASIVKAWVRINVKASESDDLFQDVWLVFYSRWRGWRTGELDPSKRPILSFLYRTFHYLLRGFRRRELQHASETVETAKYAQSSDGPEKLYRQIELKKCLSVAKDQCSVEELEVLLAKLSGIPAKEIAQTLEISEAAVDHRFRQAVGRIRSEIYPSKDNKGGVKNGQ